MEPLTSSSVAIDGHAVKRIREEKRLTQFYVSKVVGVTTDTVSRWENNRYPTIMRDNALKLAEALEVELEEILKTQTEVEDRSEASVSAERRKIVFFVFFFIIALTVAGYYYSQPAPVPPLTLCAKRILPIYAAPGSKVLVQVELSTDKLLKGMILKETFPSGWQLVESQPVVSHLDKVTGRARWIFRKPPLKIRIFYILAVPENVTSTADLTITGEVIANPDGQRTSTTVEAVGSMTIAPFHWADSNGDGVIDDLEILEVSDLTDEANNLHVDWDLIESIWEAGAYEWQEDIERFVPVEPPAEE